MCQVAVALWLMDRSVGNSWHAPNITSEKTLPEPQRLVPETMPYQAEQKTSHADTNNHEENIIFKCMVNGKTTYSHDPCQDGTIARQVEVNDTAGIVCPSREVIESTMATQADLRAVERQAMQPLVASVGGGNDEECKAINERIASLDAMARQPQSAPVQDWIRQERMKGRNRQFSIRC
jgi:hypothetical protein